MATWTTTRNTGAASRPSTEAGIRADRPELVVSRSVAVSGPLYGMDLIPAGWSRKHWFAQVRPCLPIATTTWRWTGVDLVLTGWLRSPGPAAVYRDAMAYYIFNVIEGGAAQATRLLRSSTWAIGPQEPHRDALAPGDLALVYLAAPERVFIGRAELASAVHDWTPAEEPASPGTSQSGVALTQYEEWDPPVPMSAVLSRIDQSAGARADFEVGVVQITSGKYETALSVAADGAKSTE